MNKSKEEDDKRETVRIQSTKQRGELVVMKGERKQQCVTSGEEGAPRSETIHPFLLLKAMKEQEGSNAPWEF